MNSIKFNVIQLALSSVFYVQIGFIRINNNLTFIVLVAPQPKAERRCKTLNISDIQCFSHFRVKAKRSIHTNPAG